jgi:hypothetical protein
MNENRDSNKAIFVSHHAVRWHVAGEKGKARVLIIVFVSERTNKRHHHQGAARHNEFLGP